MKLMLTCDFTKANYDNFESFSQLSLGIAKCEGFHVAYGYVHSCTNEFKVSVLGLSDCCDSIHYHDCLRVFTNKIVDCLTI